MCYISFFRALCLTRKCTPNLRIRFKPSQEEDRFAYSLSKRQKMSAFDLLPDALSITTAAFNMNFLFVALCLDLLNATTDFNAFFPNRESCSRERFIYVYIRVSDYTQHISINIQPQETGWFSSAVQIFQDFIKSSLNSDCIHKYK